MDALLIHKYLYGTWWTEIDQHIILGAIPLHNLNHLDLLKSEHIGAVLSILEDFEINPTLYFNPISPNDWKHNDINFLQISTEDTYGVKVEDIQRCLNYIDQQIAQERKVYIHCKAGRGRSASIVLCYLLRIVHNNLGSISEEQITEAYQHLKQLRGEVGINETQFTSIRQFVQSLREC